MRNNQNEPVNISPGDLGGGQESVDHPLNGTGNEFD